MECKKSHNWFVFSTDEHSGMLESLTINGQSMFVPNCPVGCRKFNDRNFKIGFSAIMV